MSTLGFVMLCHTAIHRAAEVARHYAERDCPVVIHVDRRIGRQDFEAFRASLSDLWNVRLISQYACEWGQWSLVAASQAASEILLREFASVRHIYLSSGACLPLRPVEDLREFLDARPRTDFIESVTTEDVDWTVGGLAAERFDLHFPFSWKRQRFFFDRAVELQRRLGYRRKLPEGIDPHLGSQWWCLTRQTLSAILQDPRRPEFDSYFKQVWIPDESYYQTLARRYATAIESRSLTLAKFDFQGKPHVFYDDHLDLLQRSDCFMARKIWPQANELYRTFLSAHRPVETTASPAKIDRVFALATERRTRGRAGLTMQARFPNENWENGKTAAEFTVLHGHDDLFEDFDAWLSRCLATRVHGHLFAKDRAHFADSQKVFAGGLSDVARLRDYNPRQFLRNLIWNTRGDRQVFAFGPRDRQEIVPDLLSDANARLWIVTGAWAAPLHQRNADFMDLRKEAAHLQRIETELLEQVKSVKTRAKVQILSLAEFIQKPMEHLQFMLDTLAGPQAQRLTEAPKIRDLSGLQQFVQNLKNQGMNPVMVGELPDETVPAQSLRPTGTKPYLVK